MSIVIPMYNLENYIEICIKSIINQKFNNYEVIIVDDGSTDNSYAICLDYANNHENISVIKKRNGGVASARNYGLKHATGKYILFLDGDDQLSSNSLDVYNQILNNKDYDIIVCARHVIIGDDIKYLPHPLSVYKHTKEESLMKLFFRADSLSGAPWQYLFKRSELILNEIEFDANYNNGEDVDFLFKYLLKNREYYISDEPLVMYRELREGSVTQEMTVKSLVSALNVVEKWYNVYFNDNDGRVYFANQYCKIIYQIIYCKGECKEFIKFINKNIIKSSKGGKYFILKFIWIILGYYYGSKIISIIR